MIAKLFYFAITLNILLKGRKFTHSLVTTVVSSYSTTLRFSERFRTAVSFGTSP